MPSRVPGLPIGSTFPFLRRMIGRGWPPSETVSCALPSPFDGAWICARAAVQKRKSERSELIESCSARSTSLGELSGEDAVRTVYRARAVSDAASGPFPQTSPITAVQLLEPLRKTS